MAADLPARAWRALRRLARSTPLAAVAVSLVALGVRAAGLSRAFELWVDEFVYAYLGDQVAAGRLPNLFGRPFRLHPPGWFLIEAAGYHIAGVSGSAIGVALQLRWINAVLGSVSVGLAFVLVKTLTRTRIAALAAVVLIFDPFLLRHDSRVLIETSATAAMLGGLLLLVRCLPHPRRGTGARWRAWTGPVLAGLPLGYAVLCKDVFLIYAVAPVALAMLWRHTVPPRTGGLALAGAAVPYGAYLAVLATSGVIGAWWRAKIGGIERLLGLVQITGFNAPAAPSILGRVAHEFGQYGTSYLLLFACPVAGLLAAFSDRADRRLIGLVATTAGVLGGYAAALGTFEEHYGYVVVVAGVTASAVVLCELLERRARRWLRVLVFSAVAALVVLSVALGVRVEVTRDNGFQRAGAWFDGNLPAGARVAVTNTASEWAFRGDPRFQRLVTLPQFDRAGARYVLTVSSPTRQGYSYAKPALLDWLAANAQPVFRASGPTNGETVIWYLSDDVLRRGAAAGIGA